MDDVDWKTKLTPAQYHVLREQGTEAPGSGELLYNDKDGMYSCAACHTPLFKSDDKYESTMPGLIGWPSFSAAADNDAIELIQDSSLGMVRTEVRCKNCGSHLGHLFDDASASTGQHFCINSVALDFIDKK
jgi:peptide-methionine (R)-S-oxide reductase